MAGDWIKIRVDLTDDPNVFMLSELLSLDCPTVVGHLVMFWGWMDRHTADGIEIKLTENVIDKKIGVPGFSNALRQIGWLTGENMALALPNFERHNGASAKARALESEAKRLRRGVKDDAPKAPENSVRQMSDKTRLECPTREEKRREEKNTTKPKDIAALTDGDADNLPTAVDPVKRTTTIPPPELITKKGRKLTGKSLVAFELFWAAFNYKHAKAAAADSWMDIKGMDDDLLDVILKSAQTVAKHRAGEIAANRTPIYPQGWLTGRRWEDEPPMLTSVVPLNGKGRQAETVDQFRERVTDRSWAG